MEVFAPKSPGEKQFSWQHYPPLGCSDEDALAFAKKVLTDKGRLLRWNLLRMARNLHAYHGRFVRMEPRLMADTTGGYRFKEIDFGGKYPPEPDNRIAPGVDNTVSRLTRNEYEPTVIAERHIPEWEAAARKAKDVLLHDIRQQAWPEARDALGFDLTIYGTCGARAIWDEKATDFTVLASPDAAICPGCGMKMASTTLPLNLAKMGLPAAMGVMELRHQETWQPAQTAPGRPREVQLTHCPMCEQMTPLAPYQVTPEEADEQQDPWNRPLGIMVPKGDGLIQVLNMFGVRPQNGGAGVEPPDCKVIGYKSVQELEWIATRHPDKADDLNKGDVQDMMKLDPMMGDPAFGQGAAGQDIYDHHQVYGEVYVEPLDLPGLELGRRIIVAGDQVLANDELMVEMQRPVPGDQDQAGAEQPKPRKIRRVHHEFARYNRVPNVFWGKTPVDNAVPLNRRLLRIDWQIEELRERGMPWYALPPGAEIQDRADNTGAYRYTEVTGAEGGGWNPREALVQANPGNGNAYMLERDRIISAIETVLGPAPFESGINQPSVKSGDHLQILADEAAQKRGRQERALTTLHERLWTAHLEQTWAFRKDKCEYEVEKTGTKYEQESYEGTDLQGQTRVKVESSGSVSRSVFEGKAVQAALAVPGLVDIQTDDAAREKALELMGIPKLNENYSIQVSGAQQAWSEFLTEGRIPFIDTTIHDPWIWYRILGKRWQEDEAIERQRAVGWEDVAAKLMGFERSLQQAEELDTKQRAIYEGFPPEQWPQIDAEGREKATLAGMAAQWTAPPQDGQFLPESLLDRIMLVFLPRIGDRVLPEEQMAVLPESAAKPYQDLELLLQLYATIQFCRLEAERKKANASAGGMELAAPGGAGTPQGTEPVAGAPVMPAPGGGAANVGAAA